ncbi:hypothetical protein [Bradyrhizobium sp. SZCCHNS1012]|uniref:portal protein n=1 Tax=Bradyrhizobium sp. SZCCHNS1012 TaxID=3057297 RepID=UPI002916D22A|nr:hypothetical protein [Bradyrhizobium sp. SZCCHNS1012]
MFDNDEPMPNDLDMENRRVKTAESPLPNDPDTETPRRRKGGGPSDLDGEQMMNLHATLLALYRRELDRQWENRVEQQIDEDFYDNIQWDEKDADELRERGQLPLVYNVLSTAINWVTGTEKRSRMDYKILPRRKEDEKPAERKTALMKYLSDVNRSPFNRSRAFEDTVKVGIGWLECGVEEGDGADPVYDRYESWRNMLWDSAATELTLEDARFICRAKWVDADILKAIFTKRASLIDESVDHENIYASGIEADGDEAMDSIEIARDQGGSLRDDIDGYYRPRVRAIEMWFRKPTSVHKMIGGVFAGDIYDFSDAHDEEVRSGRARIEKRATMRMYVAIFTANGMLYCGESPYRHNRFPFTPIWAYRRGRDGMPYGMIRGLRDIQTDINKRASKALHILSSNKVIMDEGALPDDVSLEEFADEVARPDAILVKKTGKELKIDVDRELAAPHLELMSRSIQMIQQQSGITDELMGRHTNATSGIAIQRRQDQGSTTTTNIFDRLRLANACHGEKQLSLIEQFYTEQKDFRITNMRGTPQYVTANSGLPEDDITRSKADFIISESDWHASLRQAAAESLLESLKVLPPQVALAMIDLVVENMDLPNREEIVKRIRAATGLNDPDQTEPTPEQVQAAQAKAKAEQMQAQMMQAELATKVSNALKAKAQAELYGGQLQKLLADIRLTLANAVNANTAAQGQAIDAAIKMLAAPPAAPIADHLLIEAGFEPVPEQQAHANALLHAIDQGQASQPGPGPAALPPPGPAPDQPPMPMPPPGAPAPGLGAGPA